MAVGVVEGVVGTDAAAPLRFCVVSGAGGAFGGAFGRAAASSFATFLSTPAFFCFVSRCGAVAPAGRCASAPLIASASVAVTLAHVYVATCAIAPGDVAWSTYSAWPFFTLERARTMSRWVTSSCNGL